MLPIEQTEIISEKIDFMNSEDLLQLLDYLPFHNLTNVSILNYEEVRTNIQLLTKLFDKSEYFKDPRRVQLGLEFVIRTIYCMEKVDYVDILGTLLKLINKYVSRVSVYDLDVEKILHVVAFASKLTAFEAEHAPDVSSIIFSLLIHQSTVQSSTDEYVADIAERLKTLGTVHEMAVITGLVVQRFPLTSKAASICISWLSIYGPSYLTPIQTKSTVSYLLAAMNELYFRYIHVKCSTPLDGADILDAVRSFLATLPNISDTLLNFRRDQCLMDESLKLFSVAYCAQSGEDPEHLLSRLQQLPLELEDWPDPNCDTFFDIVAFLCTHCRPVWSAERVLSTISALVYSHRRFSLETQLLKKILYIYPILSVEYPTKLSRLLGDDLLVIMSKRFYELDVLYTCHTAQLVWILTTSDSKLLVQHVLCHWLREGDSLDRLARIVSYTKANVHLLEILKNRYVEEDIIERAIQVIKMLKDTSLNTVIANTLPLVYKRPKIFGRLLLSDPGVFNCRSLILCEFMSMAMVLIENEAVLRCACVYVERMMRYLKNEKSVVDIFFKDLRNVKFLLSRVQGKQRVQCDTAVAITGMLNTLVALQRRHQIVIDSNLEVNLNSFLDISGPELAVNLNFIELVVVSKNIFIKIEKDNIEILIKNLLGLSRDRSFSSKSFTILAAILKGHRWLATVPALCIFIEVHCSLEVGEDWPQFFRFLQCWLKIVKHSNVNELPYLPDKRIVRSYLLRIPNMPSTTLYSFFESWNSINSRRTDKLAIMFKREL